MSDYGIKIPTRRQKSVLNAVTASSYLQILKLSDDENMNLPRKSEKNKLGRKHVENIKQLFTFGGMTFLSYDFLEYQ